MKKVYFKYNNQFQRYTIFERSANNHSELNYFKMALGNYYNYIDQDFYIIHSLGDVIIGYSPNIKSEISGVFENFEEEQQYIIEYNFYRDKRAQEVPRIITTEKHFEKAKQAMREVHQGNYEYVMLSLRKEDGYDVVDIEGKHELSAQDIEYIAKEHELYLLYKEAYDLCEYDTRSIYDDKWRSPKDSVFNADIEKYLGRKTCLYGGDRIWSKAEIVQDVLKQLKEGVPTYLIVHSIAWHENRYLVDPDENFKKIIQFYYFKDRDLQKTSRKELQDIFDRLSLGQDVVLPDAIDADY